MKQIYLLLLLLITGTAAYAQCSSTVPANAVKVKQDSTIATNIGTGQVYLICEGAHLTYNGTQSVEVIYYLEAGARVTSLRTHTAKVHMKENSLFNAGYSGSNSWAIITDIWHHPTATLTDTMAVASNNMNECPTVTFNYSQSGSCSGGGTASLQNFNSIQDIKVFPNPANNVLNIDLGLTNKVQSITIMNVLGGIEEVVHPKNKSFITLNISDYKPGAYFVRSTAINGESVTHKVVITN
jgi:hypothetical protein